MKKLISYFLLLVTLVTFSSCDETKKVIDVAGTVQLSGNYTITNVDGVTIPANDLTLTLAALDKSARGTTGCNSFIGNYTLDLYTINFGEMAVTERYCDESVMNVEKAYLRALSTAGSYSLQNNTLTLFSKNDRSVLITATKSTGN